MKLTWTRKGSFVLGKTPRSLFTSCSSILAETHTKTPRSVTHSASPQRKQIDSLKTSFRSLISAEGSVLEPIAITRLGLVTHLAIYQKGQGEDTVRRIVKEMEDAGVKEREIGKTGMEMEEGSAREAGNTGRKMEAMEEKKVQDIGRIEDMEEEVMQEAGDTGREMENGGQKRGEMGTTEEKKVQELGKIEDMEEGTGEAGNSGRQVENGAQKRGEMESMEEMKIQEVGKIEDMEEGIREAGNSGRQMENAGQREGEMLSMEEKKELVGNIVEEKAHKRSRETDSTQSPPAKKIHSAALPPEETDLLLTTASTHTPCTVEKTDMARETVAFIPESIKGTDLAVKTCDGEGRDIADERRSVEVTTDKSEKGKDFMEDVQMSVEVTTGKSEKRKDFVEDEEMSVEVTDKSEKRKDFVEGGEMSVEITTGKSEKGKGGKDEQMNQGIEVVKSIKNENKTALEFVGEGGEAENKYVSVEVDESISGETEGAKTDPGLVKMETQRTSNQTIEMNIKVNENQITAVGSEELDEKFLPEEKTKPEAEQVNLDNRTTSNKDSEMNIKVNENQITAVESEELDEKFLPGEKTKPELKQVNLNDRTTSNKDSEMNIDPTESHTVCDTLATEAQPLITDMDVERNEYVASTGGREVTKSPKKGKRHKEKSSKKESPKGKHEDKKPRPNYFVGIQITNPEIHRKIVKVQEDMISCEESLGRTLIDVATSHITLFVAHLDTQKDIDVAIGALEESAARIKDEISASPIKITFSGIGNFSHQVLFADVCKDEHYHRLVEVTKCVRGVFEEYGVCIPDKRDQKIHLTIAKLSKAPSSRTKHAVVRKIDPSYYSQHLDLHFGTQMIAGIQLLSMNKGKDIHRYYHSDKQSLFDVKIEEDKDHSLCCFPRRPILPHTPHRTLTTTTTTTEEGEAPSSLFRSVAGVTTLVAGALVLGFILARLRR